MANSSTPFGFMPYGRINGGAPTYELEQININSSDTNLYFTGDLVIRSTSGGNNTITTSTGVGGTIAPAGVFWGCEFFSAAVGFTRWSRFYPGSVGTNAANGVTRGWIISDPNSLFRAVSAGTFVAADVGLNTIIVTSQSSLGNTATGQSAMILSTATTANASAPWKIFDLLANKSVSGTPGTEAGTFNQVVVAPNSWERQPGTVAGST